ncbi:hypothetical protein, partial [Nesterenkonia rhizosphaerae]|uniref:hypothetical protein n=1 Tax=Nesterenkonia rhizosphaerae TaxID=1348272 RepID=UPI0031E78438
TTMEAKMEPRVRPATAVLLLAVPLLRHPPVAVQRLRLDLQKVREETTLPLKPVFRAAVAAGTASPELIRVTPVMPHLRRRGHESPQ